MRSLYASVMLALLAMGASAAKVVVLGEVLDAEANTPLTGIEVRLLVPGGVRATARTDVSGGFVLRAETYAPMLALEAAETSLFEGATVVGVRNGQAVTLRLKAKGPGVEGTITDRVTHRAVPFAAVRLGSGETVLATALADEDGHFRLPFPASSLAPGAEPIDVADLWVDHRSSDYLPLKLTTLAPDAENPLLLEAPLEVTPAYGVLRIECLEATTGVALRQARLRFGGRLSTGWTQAMTDAGGALVLRLPVWERPDLPLEENHLRSDYHVALDDTRYGYVHATGITVPPGVSATPGTVLAMSLVPVADATGTKQSTFSLVILDPGDPDAFSGAVAGAPTVREVAAPAPAAGGATR
jgi:hypothetical protein